MTIKLVVTRQRYEEVMDVDTAFYLLDSSDKEVYDKMLEFVVDADGKYIGREAARKLFKKVPLKELHEHILRFLKAISEAFVNPTKESGSSLQSDLLSKDSPSESLPAGSPS
jgi:hypothetical protein